MEGADWGRHRDLRVPETSWLVMRLHDILICQNSCNTFITSVVATTWLASKQREEAREKLWPPVAVFGASSVRPYAKASTFISKSICSVFSIKETITGAGETVQHVFALTKDLSLAPGTHMAALNHLQFQSQGI